MGGLLAVCCWRLAEPKVKMQCSSRIKATNRSSASVSCDLFGLVSLGIFAHGAVALLADMHDHISTG